MPQFRYEGTNLENKVVRGTIDAVTESDCYGKLKERNIYAYSLVEKAESKGAIYRLKFNELAEFARQVSTMHSAGIPIVRTLDVMKERVIKSKLLAIYDTLLQSVVNGHTISEAMEQCSGSFPDMMIHMFRAGEANGRLDDVAAKMAKYYDSEHKIHGKIRNAMIYPVILATVTLAVIVILFTFVLPKIFALITSGGGTLTGLTLFMVNISDILINQWYIVLAVVAALVLLTKMLMRRYATEIDHYKLRLPIFGRLLSIIYTASFARTLSSLYGSGITMIEAVEMSVKTIGNHYIESQFDAVIGNVKSGSSLSNAIHSVDGFERKLISAVYVGEETGRLDVMLEQISQEYEYESATAIERMLTFVEPIMLVIMGIVIALVLVSVMGPMTQMYSAIG